LGFPTGCLTRTISNISRFDPLSTPHIVTVGNGNSIPISSSSHSSLRTPSGHVFKLNNVLLVPNLIRNLLSIRKFTRDYFCSIEFDAFGFAMKNMKTRRVILRCNSAGNLYTFPGSIPARRFSSTTMVVAASVELWHQRLGHPGHDAMLSLWHLALIKCNKNSRTRVCHACQLGKHVCLQFSQSTTASRAVFDLIHCVLWTSPIISISGF
jgi:hypothetical protein